MQVKTYDIKIRTYEYAKLVIGFLEKLPKDYISQTLGKQLLRSATSVGANIMEAQAASSKKDFSNYYSHSLKSANESKFWLNLLLDCNKASKESLKNIFQETEEIANILAASLLTLRAKREKAKVEF